MKRVEKQKKAVVAPVQSKGKVTKTKPELTKKKAAEAKPSKAAKSSVSPKKKKPQATKRKPSESKAAKVTTSPVSLKKEKPQPTKRKSSESKATTSPSQKKEKVKEAPIIDDETVIQTCDIEGEITVARSPKIRAYQLMDGVKWEEIGPGSVKLTVNKELVQPKKRKMAKTSEAQGRLIFHDARNRNVRLNIAIGSSFTVAQEAQKGNPKVLTFSAMSEKEVDGKVKILQETFLIKETNENPPAESVEKFKSVLIEWNSKVSK